MYGRRTLTRLLPCPKAGVWALNELQGSELGTGWVGSGHVRPMSAMAALPVAGLLPQQRTASHSSSGSGHGGDGDGDTNAGGASCEPNKSSRPPFSPDRKSIPRRTRSAGNTSSGLQHQVPAVGGPLRLLQRKRHEQRAQAAGAAAAGAKRRSPSSAAVRRQAAVERANKHGVF